MINPDPMALDALDRFLDTVADDGEATGRGRSPVEADPADRTVYLTFLRRDDAPAPGRAFVADLRSDLMNDLFAQPSTSRNGQSASTTHDVLPISFPVAPAPRRDRPITPLDRILPRAWSDRWMRLGEALVAGLLVLIVAALAAGNGHIPAFLGLFQDDSSPTAMFLGDAARTGQMPGPGPTGDPGLLWRRWGIMTEGDSPGWSPVVAEGKVYAAISPCDRSEGATCLVALALLSGAILWQTPAEGLWAGGAPAVAEGLVFVGTTVIEGLATPEAGPATVIDHGWLIALDAETGVERWRYETGPSGYLSPVVADGVVYIGSVDGTLHAVDAVSGERRWTFAVPSDGQLVSGSAPAVANGLVYIASNAGVLHAIDATSGEERWSAAIGGNYPTTPVVADGAVYVGTNAVPMSGLKPAGPDGFDRGELIITDDDTPAVQATDIPTVSLPTGHRVYALDATSGEQRWTAEVDHILRLAPTSAGGMVFVAGLGSNGNEVRALDAATGEHVWTFAADAPVDAAPVIADGVVYVGSFDSKLYALDTGDGSLHWSVRTASEITTTPFIADGVVVVGDLDGILYAIAAVEGGIGTPIGTPVSDGDVSTLGDCSGPARPEVTQVPLAEVGPATPEPDATPGPAASLLPVTDKQRRGSVPGISSDNLPAGKLISPETFAALEATIDQMNACNRPGEEERIAAFYSDDFYLRPWVRVYFRYGGYWTWTPPGPGSEFGPFDSAVMLPDGRVAMVFAYQFEQTQADGSSRPADAGWLVVWVEQDGRWLIDEMAEISEDGGEGRG